MWFRQTLFPDNLFYLSMFLSTRFFIRDKLAAHAEDATRIGLLNFNPAIRADKSISFTIKTSLN
jgi:hypothetical protein